MKLHHLLRSSVATAAVAILFTTRRCEATNGIDKPSHPNWLQSDHTGSQLTPETHINLVTPETYINLIDVNQIIRLPSKSVLPSGQHPDPQRPFYGRTPLYSVDTDVATIEQALRTYERVGIVDPENRTAREIVFDRATLRLEQRAFPNLDEALRLYSLDGNVHVLIKHLQNWNPGFGRPMSGVNWPMPLPPVERIRHLPHLGNVPILQQGSDSLGHMLQASYPPAHKFWHRRPGQPDVLINPYEHLAATEATQSDTERIDSVLRKFDDDAVLHKQNLDAAAQIYGKGTASIVMGEPIFLPRRIDQPFLREYPRFDMGADLKDLIAALQKYGRYRIYNTASPHEAYKVKVQNIGDPPGAPLIVSVKRLTRYEKSQEKLAEKIGWIHLPH